MRDVHAPNAAVCRALWTAHSELCAVQCTRAAAAALRCLLRCFDFVRFKTVAVGVVCVVAPLDASAALLRRRYGCDDMVYQRRGRSCTKSERTRRDGMGFTPPLTCDTR